MPSTRIVKQLEYSKFKQLIYKYKNHIVVSPHAVFRLSEAQRKVYKGNNLTNVLVTEKPRLFGMQQNGRFSAFFRRKVGYLRIIFNVNHPKNIEIITFYITNKLPK